MDQRRQQIERICQAAADLQPNERDAFLAQECRADSELRREVESLLKNNESSLETLLDRPSVDQTQTLLDPSFRAELPRGTSLGPYRIERLLGAGGMGSVYQARDSRVGRAIAIKVCAREFSGRFERETRAIASLAHPNICTLFDVGPNYIVMELLEGQTLADRLRKGPLPLQEALQYGSQIADAVAAAHAHGIIHRDLKPANIMLVKSGIKVLDFGLAKVRSVAETLTVTNAVLGTPAYMAPEQRQGGETDARTDIYGIGLVLYEMVTGKRFAPGGTFEISGPAIQAHVLQRCIAEDPAERWQTAADLKRELDWAARSLSAISETPHKAKHATLYTAIGVALFAVGLAIGWGIAHMVVPESDSRPITLSINAPPGAELQWGVAMSPDGERIAFAASAGRESLWVRSLSDPLARELPGTEGAAFPFWSADSRSVGYFANGKLKRVDVETGLSSVICAVGLGRGGAWGPDGTILFNAVNDGPLIRVPAAGGEPVPFTKLDPGRGENSHRFPYFLPDGRRFLYFIRSANREAEGVYIGNLDRPQEKTQLLRNPNSAIYAPSSDGKSGYLIWLRDRSLYGQQLDSRGEQLLGEPVTLAEGDFDRNSSLSDVSAGRHGRIAYRNAAGSMFRPTWYDRKGQPVGTVGPADSYRFVSLSESSRILVWRAASQGRPAGFALLESSLAVPRPLQNANSGVLSSDGKRMAYSWTASGAPNIYTMDVDGAASAERLTESGNSQGVTDWSRDGRFLLYAEMANNVVSGTRSDLWALSVADRKAVRLMTTPARETHGKFSPDSKWVAYTSDETGRPEIFIAAFPPGGPKWQISNTGGDFPRWSEDGNELFYMAPDGNLVSVGIRFAAGRPEAGTPSALFKMPGGPRLALSPDAPYDVARDGRILALSPTVERAVPSLSVVLGWEALLGRRTK